MTGKIKWMKDFFCFSCSLCPHLIICLANNCFVRLLLLSFILFCSRLPSATNFGDVLWITITRQLFLADSFEPFHYAFFFYLYFYFISLSIHYIVDFVPASAYFNATCYQLLMVFWLQKTFLLAQLRLGAVHMFWGWIVWWLLLWTLISRLKLWLWNICQKIWKVARMSLLRQAILLGTSTISIFFWQQD